ncbi:LSU ribosomal protein L21p [Desulfurella amilsii]|uniref:Large ribosomal subunit protein bL21 n=1 Tax=Desulfurella amilsii TaxID=1562698 RepID=A0A1X4XWH1_9BACT|nr:50S ribosomal protein L21 [Desulfurella amilsii]OSS41890.1 LSU ribosomal protein L21p [Desulfurella amilsii]
MFAVVETGSKQYIVKEGDILRVEKLNVAKGDEIEFDKVIMVDDKIGNPYVENAKVKGTVIAQGKAKKIIVFKFKRRKGFKKKIGHRQHFTQVKITQILA